jgi:hypothetical protein
LLFDFELTIGLGVKDELKIEYIWEFKLTMFEFTNEIYLNGFDATLLEYAMVPELKKLELKWLESELKKLELK